MGVPSKLKILTLQPLLSYLVVAVKTVKKYAKKYFIQCKDDMPKLILIFWRQKVKGGGEFFETPFDIHRFELFRKYLNSGPLT